MRVGRCITFVLAIGGGSVTCAQKYCIIRPLFDAAVDGHDSVGNVDALDAQSIGDRPE
jgi:hypothetical protein